MPESLLDQFLAEECTPYVRRLLEEALADTSSQRHHFEFNRFEVTFERETDIAILEDVLDTTPAGTQRVPLAELASALGRRSV
jgi:hypothetical protein